MKYLKKNWSICCIVICLLIISSCGSTIEGRNEIFDFDKEKSISKSYEETYTTEYSQSAVETDNKSEYEKEMETVEELLPNDTIPEWSYHKTMESEKETDDVDESITKDTYIDEQVLFASTDADCDVTISAQSLKKTSTGYVVELLIENNTTDNLLFYSCACAVNGIMIPEYDYYLSSTVLGGREGGALLTINDNSLSTFCIDNIHCIHLDIRVVDAETNMPKFATGLLSIKTNNYDGLHLHFEGTRLFSQDGITIDYWPFSERNCGVVLISNKTDEDIHGNFFDIRINDIFYSDVYDELDFEILSECQIFYLLAPDDQFLIDYSIDKLENIEFWFGFHPSYSGEDNKMIGPLKYNDLL